MRFALNDVKNLTDDRFVSGQNYVANEISKLGRGRLDDVMLATAFADISDPLRAAARELAVSLDDDILDRGRMGDSYRPHAFTMGRNDAPSAAAGEPAKGLARQRPKRCHCSRYCRAVLRCRSHRAIVVRDAQRREGSSALRHPRHAAPSRRHRPSSSRPIAGPHLTQM